MAKALPQTDPWKQLCADPDRIRILPEGWAIAVAPDTDFERDDPFLGQMYGGLAPSSQAPAIFPKPGESRSAALKDKLAREPREALDGLLLVVTGETSLADLGELADAMRVDVMARATGKVMAEVARLASDADDDFLENGRNRVRWLDAARSPTSADAAVWVGVATRFNRAANAWTGAPESALEILSGQRYLPGRIVFSREGAELGLPAALVTYRHGAVLRAHGLGTVSTVDDAALAAAGTGRAERVASYPELMDTLHGWDPGAHGLVLLHSLDSGAVRVLLALVEAAERDGAPGGVNVSFVDLATSAPAVFPNDFRELRLAALPGFMPLADRLDALARAWPGSRTRPTLDSLDDVYTYVWNGGNGEPVTIDMIGDGFTVAELDQLAVAMELVGVPGIALGGRDKDPTPHELALLEQCLVAATFAPRGAAPAEGRTPIVYTRARFSEQSRFTDMLDMFGAVLVYQAPGGDGLLNLGNTYRIRPPGHAEETEDPPQPQDTLTDGFVRAAAELRKLPDFEVPSPPAAALLFTSLKDEQAISAVLGQHGSHLVENRAQVAAIAGKIGSFAGHDAVLSLAKPLLVDPAGSPERIRRIEVAAPHLAALAGVEFSDRASHFILAAIGDLLEGRRGEAEVKEAVHEHWPSLPREGGVVRDWIRVLQEVARQEWVAPGHQGALAKIAEIIATCPDKAPELAPAST